jgi:hypothetical protein
VKPVLEARADRLRRAVDPADQVSALEDATAAVQQVAAAAVAALRHGPNRFLVAERLHRLAA